MPTGYTAEVGESDKYTFEDFVWACARGFGALIHMRDDSQDAKITLPETSSYYVESLERETKELKRFEEMTLAEAEIECNEEYEKHQKLAKEEIKRKNEMLLRYEAMLEKCKAWLPPTENHFEMKKFMIQQLTSTIESDCRFDYYEKMLSEKKQTAKVWLKEAIRSKKEDIEYHTKHLKEERERNNGRIEWIMQLQHSVPLPKKYKK